MNGRLSVVPERKVAIFESGLIDSPNAVIFVGGLTDGLGSVAYLPLLSEALEKQGWGLVNLQLSSCYTQYGFKSLETDARDIEATVKYLRTLRGKEKLVLLGHSTGCQDAIWYTTVNSEGRPKVNAAILQAPVSDVEYFEKKASIDASTWVAVAEGMVREGRGLEYLPKDASRSVHFGVEHPAEDALTPFTAYRYASLYGRGGDDDFFSSFIEEQDLKFANSSAPLLLFLGDEDDAYPETLQSYQSKVDLLEKWAHSSRGKISPLSTVLKKANHPIDNPEAREEFSDIVIKFIQSL